VVNSECTFLVLVNVYGNSNAQNKVSFSKITNVGTQLKSKLQTNFVLIGGDFNLAPDEWLVIQVTILITFFVLPVKFP